MPNLVNNVANFGGFSEVGGSIPSPSVTAVVSPSVFAHAISTGEKTSLALCVYAYADFEATPPLTPIALQSITDNAGNTWVFSTGSNSQNPPAIGISDTVNPDYTTYTLCAIAYCLRAKPVTSVTVTLTNPAYFLGLDLYEADQVPFNAVVTGAAGAGAAGGGEVSSYATPTISVNEGDFVVAVSTPKNGWEHADSPYSICPNNGNGNGAGSGSAYWQAATAGPTSCTFDQPYKNDGTPGGTTQWVDAGCILAFGGSGPIIQPGRQVTWPGGDIPATGNIANETPVNGTLGTQVTYSQTVWAVAYRFFSPGGVNPSAPPSACALWNDTAQTIVAGTEIDSPLWDGALAAGTWIEQPLPEPVELAAATSYIPSVLLAGSAEGYGFTTGVSYPFSNGGVVTAHAARSNIGASLAYPERSDTGSAYFADLVVSLTNPASGGLLLSCFP